MLLRVNYNEFITFKRKDAETSSTLVRFSSLSQRATLCILLYVMCVHKEISRACKNERDLHMSLGMIDEPDGRAVVINAAAFLRAHTSE